MLADPLTKGMTFKVFHDTVHMGVIPDSTLT